MAICAMQTAPDVMDMGGIVPGSLGILGHSA